MAKQILTNLDLLALPSLTTPKTGSVGFGAKTDGLYQKVGTVESKLSTTAELLDRVKTAVPSGAKFTDTTYVVATTSANGLMSSGDKTKLNGIASNANNYSLPTASGSVLGGIKVGSRLAISSGVLSANVQSDNNFTTALKNKLDGIATEANKYVHPSSHPISFITGLQSALDGKSATGHTHSYLPLAGGTMANTNLVKNLNADLLDGYHVSETAATGVLFTYGAPNAGGTQSWYKLGTLYKPAVTGSNLSKVVAQITGLSSFGGNDHRILILKASTRGSISVTGLMIKGDSASVRVGHVDNGSNIEIWVGYAGTYNTATNFQILNSANFTVSRDRVASMPTGFVAGPISISATTDSNVASATNCSRSISAGNGLTGGGALTANRTLTLGTPSAITLSSTDSVATSSHAHSLALGGTASQYLNGATALKTIPTITAGNGLSGGGQLTATRTLTLGTPSTLNNSSTNGVTGTSHTHAITTTTVGAAKTIVATDASGGVRGSIIRIGANWTLELSGTELQVKYGGVVKQRMLSDGTFAAEGGVSALGLGTGGSTGSSYERLDSWSSYDAGKGGWVLSALLGKDLDTRVTNLGTSVSNLNNSIPDIRVVSSLPTYPIAGVFYFIEE